MTPDEFWTLIEQSRKKASTPDDQVDVIVDTLKALPLAEIIAFDRQVWRLLAESYRWDLWAAAYIINDGCSDDGFEYFRGWLLLQGRAVWEAALKDPQSLADLSEEALGNGVECEMMLGAGAEAYEEAVEEEIPDHGQRYPDDPLGKPWEEEELSRLYPKLWARFTGE